MNTTYILTIETTGAYASVALLQADGPDCGLSSSSADTKTGGSLPGQADEKAGGTPRVLGVIHGNDRFSHLQNLTPQIDRILKENGLSVGDITAVAVSHGPGSFTGIRIGVSTARALAQVLDIPCIPVSSLEALALRADQSAKGMLICPVLDARRKQVYGAAYEIIDGRPVCRIEPASCLMTEFLQKLEERLGDEPAAGILFIGDGIDTCGGIIGDWRGQTPVFLAEEAIRYQDASTVALRGWQLLQDGKSCGYMQLQPEYLRMAEAEKKLRDRQAAGKREHP